jgi:hypothetical protein
MKIDFAKAILKPPAIRDPNDPRWKGAGDPRPLVTHPRLTEPMEIVTEERTPYEVSLNGKLAASNGSGSPTSFGFGEASVRQPFLRILIPPTRRSATKLYRHEVKPDGTPRPIEREKAQLTLPWTIDITARTKKGKPKRYYLAFDIMLGSSYQAPTRNLYSIVMQGWQGLGHGPPIEMNALYNELDGKVPFEVLARNDKTEARNKELLAQGLPQTANLTVAKFGLERAKWHRIIFQLQPNHNGQSGKGQVALMVNGVWLSAYRGDWGYKPTRAKNNNIITLGIGIYRSSQLKTQSVLFKDVRWARTYKGVTS